MHVAYAATGAAGIVAAAEAAAATLAHRADFRGFHRVAGRGEIRLKSAALARLAESWGLRPGAKTITAAVERGGSAFAAGLLRGLFDADGSVQGTPGEGRQRSPHAKRRRPPRSRAAHAAAPRHRVDASTANAIRRGSRRCRTAAAEHEPYAARAHARARDQRREPPGVRRPRRIRRLREVGTPRVAARRLPARPQPRALHGHRRGAGRRRHRGRLRRDGGGRPRVRRQRPRRAQLRRTATARVRLLRPGQRRPDALRRRAVHARGALRLRRLRRRPSRSRCGCWTTCSTSPPGRCRSSGRRRWPSAASGWASPASATR